MQLALSDRDVDLTVGRVRLATGSGLALSALESRLLRKLAEHPGVVHSREKLERALWPEGGKQPGSNALTMLVRRLRDKLEENPKAPRHLLALRGQGYILELGPEAGSQIRPEIALLKALQGSAPGMAAGIAMVLLQQDGLDSPAVAIVDELLEAEGDLPRLDRAALLLMRARAHIKANSPAEALADFSESGELLRDEDPELLRMLVEEGKFASDMRKLRHDRAAHVSRAKEMEARANALLAALVDVDERARARVLGSLGVTRRWQGDVKGAEAAYREAAEVARRCGDRDAQYKSGFNVAILLKERFEFTAALEQLDQIVLEARRLGRREHADTLREISDVRHRRGDFAEARDAAQAALDMTSDVLSPAALIFRTDLVAIKMDLREFDDALQDAHAIRQDADGVYEVAAAVASALIGLTGFVNGRTDVALVELEEAATRANAGQLPGLELIARAYRSLVGAAVGDPSLVASELDRCAELRDLDVIGESPASTARLLTTMAARMAEIPTDQVPFDTFEVAEKSRRDMQFRKAWQTVQFALGLQRGSA